MKKSKKAGLILTVGAALFLAAGEPRPWRMRQTPSARMSTSEA